MLRNDPRFVHVREAIDRREAEIQARLKIGAEQVLEELSKVAFFSLGDVVVIQDDGTASLDLTEADAAHLAALSEIQIEERIIKGRGGEPDTIARTIKIKAHSKLEALEKLGKNLKLYTEKVEVSGGLDIASQLTWLDGGRGWGSSVIMRVKRPVDDVDIHNARPLTELDLTSEDQTKLQVSPPTAAEDPSGGYQKSRCFSSGPAPILQNEFPQNSNPVSDQPHE
jgi:hypothetical protein